MTLELAGIGKSVAGRVHIHKTDMTLQKGNMNVLLGATGSGKTSLLRLMAGLDRPTAGRVLWNGQDVTGKRVQDRQIAMVYQQFINYPTLSVYENIAAPLHLKRQSKAKIDTAVREAAALLHLENELARRPAELSGGQQQRCALARALVKNAGLVLLDEPLANLDYKLREELRAELPKIFAAAGAIFVYATTEPEEALLLGGHTATLHEGRVTQFGPAAQVYRRPRDRITAGIYSDPPMNFIAVTKNGERLDFASGHSVPAPAGLADGCYDAGFRPNHLALQQGSAKALAFKCRLGISEITGSETYLHLDHDQHAWSALLAGVHDLQPGQEVDLWLDPARVFLFAADGTIAAPAACPAAA